MHYTYDFDCRNCQNRDHTDGGTYCVPIRSGSDPITVDPDERVLRCSGYMPAQISMFEEGGSHG